MALGTFRYMRRNPELVVGLCLLFALLAFVAIGHAFVDLDKARPLSGRPLLPPSASLPGMSPPAIIVKEVLPNLMPYIVASLVGSVSAAVLASVGLEVLGLGSFDSLTIGMTLYWVIYYAAIINSWWWWWLPPIIIIIILFTGLFLMAVGLDELSNPRLRRRA